MSPYEILGVSEDANSQEIKQAYRKLAKQYHPDIRKGDDNAEQRFKIIAEAYRILLDPELRKSHDNDLANTRTRTQREQEQRSDYSNPYEVDAKDVPFFQWKMVAIILMVILITGTVIFLFWEDVKPKDQDAGQLQWELKEDAEKIRIESSSGKIDIYSDDPRYELYKAIFEMSKAKAESDESAFDSAAFKEILDALFVDEFR